jgi:hypothetical protein
MVGNPGRLNYTVRLIDRGEVIEYRDVNDVYRFSGWLKDKTWRVYLPGSKGQHYEPRELTSEEQAVVLPRIRQFLESRKYFGWFGRTYSVVIEREPRLPPRSRQRVGPRKISGSAERRMSRNDPKVLPHPRVAARDRRKWVETGSTGNPSAVGQRRSVSLRVSSPRKRTFAIQAIRLLGTSLRQVHLAQQPFVARIAAQMFEQKISFQSEQSGVP